MYFMHCKAENKIITIESSPTTIFLFGGPDVIMLDEVVRGRLTPRLHNDIID